MTLFKKLIFSACAFVLFFGLAEGVLRLVYHPYRPFRFYAPHSVSVVEQDPVLGYRLRANFHGNAYRTDVQTNSLGFRGPEFDPSTKKPFRVVALGDSCTFGFGVSDNAHTYPAQLSDLLNQAYGDAEVINAGMVGYTSYQALKLFETKIVRFHPDVVLIFIGWNDLGNSILPDWKPTMTQDVQAPSILAGSPPFVLLALSDLLSRFRPKLNIGFKAEAIDSYVVNVNKLVDAVRQIGSEPVLVTWPTRVTRQMAQLRGVEAMRGSGVLFDSWFDFYQRYQRELARIAAQKQVRTVPLAERLLHESDEALYADEIHLNDLGTKEAAKVIFDALAGFIKGEHTPK